MLLLHLSVRPSTKKEKKKRNLRYRRLYNFRRNYCLVFYSLTKKSLNIPARGVDTKRVIIAITFLLSHELSNEKAASFSDRLSPPGLKEFVRIKRFLANVINDDTFQFITHSSIRLIYGHSNGDTKPIIITSSSARI